MILTDREIKIYIQRELITVDPEPEDIAYQSTAVDLRLDPIISVFTKPPTVGGVQQITRIDLAHPDFKTEEAIRALSNNEEIDPAQGYPLEPGILILGWTKEFVDLKQSRLAARVEGKSSLARLGLSIHLTAPTIHAGFGASEDPRHLDSSIRLEIWNIGPFRIKLEKGMPICQLIFEWVDGTPEKGYAGQFSIQGPAVSTPSPAPAAPGARKRRR